MVRIFGQAMKKGTRYQQQMGSAHSKRDPTKSEEELLAARRAERRRVRKQEDEALDERFGYARFDHRSDNAAPRRGWLFNMLATTVSEAAPDEPSGPERAGLDLYFIQESGATFKSTVLYEPYFYVMPNIPQAEDQDLFLETLTTTLLRLYEASGLAAVTVVHKIDLDQVNHLSPKYRDGRPMLKLVFANTQHLMDVRKQIAAMVKKNASKAVSEVTMFDPNHMQQQQVDPLSTLVDIREYDVPYVVRVCIDLDIRAGAWYTVTPNVHDVGVSLADQDVEKKADPSFFAFDIECTKAPLKFPDSKVDSIFMISYMVNGQGYLICSRHVVSADIQDFDYTPKPSYPGPFHIFNEGTEKDLLERFFAEYRRHKPQIVVTYNGDFFDWPFVLDRAAVHGMDMRQEIGVERVSEDGEFRGRATVHLDAFHWVQRDSYLPQGSQGLKAVTKYKLGYDPVEVDPEDMLRYAQERPVHMATYSVSDAVATYYLYEKYVHLFIFSLCTIIPMGPEDVLRKGSGTLCEVLLMVQACQKSIICPNKQIDALSKFHKGHLLEAETYIGGKVECLETGVYRSDIEYDFDLKPTAFQQLIDNIDRDLTFAIEVEGGLDRTKITNYNDVRSQVVEQLEMLRDRPKRKEKPFIYHLDVGAMYPNIILTNRLQPSAMVDDATCAACDFNQAKNDCKRKMDWVWRGDYTPASKHEYDRTKDQLSRELVNGVAFHSLPDSEQSTLVSTRLKTYARKAYKKTKVTEEETRKDTVCMRENDFYVDTVRNFRDRRYELKKLTKTWTKKIYQATDGASKKDAEDRALVYESLQVAHKCILNSFYGYVMRKGARWRSMEMAGIVTKTGADLITQARILVEQIGRPLELDTDGIWCILPKSFPDVYNFTVDDGSSFKLEYPCIMLNADVHDNFTNHQYQTLKDPERGIYEARSECSIFFEVDGPYRAMILPSSLEEGKLLKKRYAVFNFDGSLAELKGFELKRRGELELIKTFQSQIFQRFLDGTSLVECYASVAEVANHWIDVLDTQGESLENDELVDLISENRSMSRQLEDYGDQKGTSQTTARRLGEFLGAEIIKDKGLNCKFIIAERPFGAPVTERAIPTAIWKAEPAVMKHYLRKWLKSPEMEGEDFDIRNILAWDYYSDRLGKTIQKIITIPAALQSVSNPVPRVPHPDWLGSKVRQLNDKFKQKCISSMFGAKPVGLKTTGLADMEDFGASKLTLKRPLVHKVKGHRRPAALDSLKISGHEDMEEFGASKSTLKRPLVKGHQRRASTGVAGTEAEGMEISENRIILSGDNFNDWLKQRKSQWRFNRRENKRLRIDAGINGQSYSGPMDLAKKSRPATMEGYMRDAAIALIQREWQVIEVREMTSSDGKTTRGGSSGQFIMWVMVGNDTLQKVQLAVPRVLYVTSHVELTKNSEDIHLKKVDKHLPHNKTAAFVYEVTMSEYLFKSQKWTDNLTAAHASEAGPDILEAVYETSTPLMLRALTDLGCVVKTNGSVDGMKKSFQLSELKRIDNPTEGEYLHKGLAFNRVFVYNGISPRTRTGIIGLFFLETRGGDENDWAQPSAAGRNRTQFNAACHIWVVKPGSKRGQKNLSVKQCESSFAHVLSTIGDLSREAEDAGQPSQYGFISPDTKCQVASLTFVDGESAAFSGVHDVTNSYSKANNGPTFLVVNSAKPIQHLRRSIPSLNSFPVISVPFPPGPNHNPGSISLPALNWEASAVGLCMEAYFYMGAVSFRKRIVCARYGRLPVGNLGIDENNTLYDVGLSRQLVKSRALSWASPNQSKPDLGIPILPSTDGGEFPIEEIEGLSMNEEDIWGDEDELVSPVIMCPGSYRGVCVEIDVHDLAIGALTDLTSAIVATGGAPTNSGNEAPGLKSPTSVSLFDGGAEANNYMKATGPLGDEMSTAISLQLLRVLVSSWLRDAFDSNSEVADEMLHHVYRLISSPNPLLNDPALHRAVHSLMKSTFLRLLGELQKLGCTIVLGSFHKVTVATNKSTLAEAEEYITFVLSTIKSRSIAESDGQGVGGLARVSLEPSHYYSQVLFHDEYNFGGVELERGHPDNADESQIVLLEDREDDEPSYVISSVVSGWGMRNFLGSELAQEYFRAIIARFSKDVLKKEQQLTERGIDAKSRTEQLIDFKRKLVTKQFANYLTRVVGEIANEGGGPESFLRLPGSHLSLTSPALEFVKSVMTVLELDSDVQNEVQILKKSLLAQLGVAEYSKSVKWENPCAKFMLHDVFCMECYECRDLNLCDLPVFEDGEAAPKRHWACDECGTSYNFDDIERRLIETANRKVLRYQLQDLRCTKTNRASTKMMSRQSDCSTRLKLDMTKSDLLSQIQILDHLAEHHELSWLHETTQGFLNHFQLA